MIIVVDENIPRMTVQELKKMNHEVIDIRGTEHEGGADDKIWELCKTRLALLITTDKGFRRRADEPHFGILIIRLGQPNRLKIHAKIIYAMTNTAVADWPGRTVILRDKMMSVIKSPQEK